MIATILNLMIIKSSGVGPFFTIITEEDAYFIAYVALNYLDVLRLGSVFFFFFGGGYQFRIFIIALV